MCSLQLFLSVDPSLGRIDYSLMSDQALMEMLIEGFDDESKKRYQDSHGMYLDVCEWSRISCDDDERVVEIALDSGSITGSLELCYIPLKVKVLKASPLFPWSALRGSVDLAHIPEGMQVLDLRKNILTGEVDLTQLPNEMYALYLHDNQLTGEIDLTNLPDGMQKLFLGNNQLTGEINLTKLPDEMYALYLHDNQLTGEIDLTHLPHAMEYLYLHTNQFTGEIDLAHLMDGMQCLSLRDNKLSGSFVAKRQTSSIVILAQGNQFNAVAVVKSETLATIKLHGSGVTSVVDENGRELDFNRFLE